MNNKQQARLTMFQVTTGVCNENAAAFSENVAFKAAFEEFQTKIAAIVSTAQQDAVIIKGITIDKNTSKEKLCGKAAEIAGVISAYASTVGNNVLKSEVDFPVSKLAKMRAASIVANCQNIHDKGTANITALADYGITSRTLGELQTLIDKYSADTTKPRSAIGSRKLTTANLATLFKETDKILKERMDKIVTVFKSSHPEFVAAYENARRVTDPPVSTTQLKGKVTDKATADPIKNATVTAVKTENGNTNETFTATTDSNGEYQIKPITNGKHKITFTAAGFNNLEAENIDIKLGEVNHVNAEMVK